uniref:Secreted protein n=1 Tax=Syphacia muris TaxID=451379 RepID=A0A0N5AW41_9BILA
MKYIVLLTNVILVTIAHGTGFEYFIFTQIYPISICRADNDKQPGACLIPEYISPWTIHGLWYTKQWLLADIRLCFNRDLEVIRCPKDEASLVTHSSSLPMSQPCPSAGILYPELEQSLKTFCFNATDASLYFILCWQV